MLAATSRPPCALTTAPAPMPAIVFDEKMSTFAEPPTAVPSLDVFSVPKTVSHEKLPPTSMLCVIVDASTTTPADQSIS